MSAHDKISEAQHQHYSFLHPSLRLDGRAQFAELVSDVSAGLALCIELVLASNFNREAGSHSAGVALPVLSIADTERMSRFAIVAAKMLGERADEQIDQLNDLARAEEAHPQKFDRA